MCRFLINQEVVTCILHGTLQRRVGWLVGVLSPVNHKKIIISGLRETFIKRYIVEKNQYGRNSTGRKERESGELSGEFME